MPAFDYRQAEEIRNVFQRHAVRYLFIDIIRSKQATRRQKDLESLPRLVSFRNWLKAKT